VEQDTSVVTTFARSLLDAHKNQRLPNSQPNH